MKERKTNRWMMIGICWWISRQDCRLKVRCLSVQARCSGSRRLWGGWGLQLRGKAYLTSLVKLVLFLYEQEARGPGHVKGKEDQTQNVAAMIWGPLKRGRWFDGRWCFQSIVCVWERKTKYKLSGWTSLNYGINYPCKHAERSQHAW